MASAQPMRRVCSPLSTPLPDCRNHPGMAIVLLSLPLACISLGTALMLLRPAARP